MFSCDSCGDNALAEYNVTMFDFTKCELCEDCLEIDTKAGRVLYATRFVGLAPKAVEA